MTTVPDDASEAERAELDEHVSGIMFNSGDVYEPDCVLCKRARELGLFAAYGITDADLDATEEH